MLRRLADSRSDANHGPLRRDAERSTDRDAECNARTDRGLAAGRFECLDTIFHD
jgi:hypothetical protein